MKRGISILISIFILVISANVAQCGSITGRVTSEGGQGISNLLVQVYSGLCWQIWRAQSTTNADGYYTIDNLSAGSYYVIACSNCTHLNYIQEWYDGADGTTACNLAQPVSVTSNGTTNVDFTLKAGPKKLVFFDVSNYRVYDQVSQSYKDESHTSFCLGPNFDKLLESATVIGPGGFSHNFDLNSEVVVWQTECRTYGKIYYYIGSKLPEGQYTLTLSFKDGTQSTYTKNLQSVSMPTPVSSNSMSYTLNDDGSIDFYWTPPDTSQEYELRIRDENGVEYFCKSHLSGSENHFSASADDLKCLKKGNKYKWFIRSYKEPIEYPFRISFYNAVAESERKDLVYNTALDIQRTNFFWIADWRDDFFTSFTVRPGSLNNVTSAIVSGPGNFSYNFNTQDDYFDFSTDASFYRGWYHNFGPPILYGDFSLTVTYADGHSDLLTRSLSPVSVATVDWQTMNVQVFENGDINFSWELPSGITGQRYKVRVRNLEGKKEYWCSSFDTDATSYGASAWELRGLQFGHVYKWAVRSYDSALNAGRESKWFYFTYDPFHLGAEWRNFSPDTWVNTQTPTCSIEVRDTDNGLDVSSAQYRISTDGGKTWSDWSTASCTGSNGSTDFETISASVNFGQDSKENNLIQFKISDTGGIESTSLPYTVRIDTTAPVISISSPLAGTTDDREPILYYTVSDLSNVAVSVKVDGSPVTKDPGDTLGPLTDGTHTIRVEGVDEANNTGFDEVTITVRTEYTKVLVVDEAQSDPQYYRAIQNAVDAANNNDKVIVKSGTYHENIDFKGKKILLISENGPGSTIIDGGENGSVITFSGTEDSGSIIDGFTIKNGNATAGGGISCTSGASPVIRNCLIINNTAQNGAGIYCGSGSSPRIRNCKIMHNHATGGSDGGGIYSTGSSPQIINNVISFNQADSSGGGIFVSGSGSPIITNNQMDGNSALYGGGIYCGGGEMTVKNNIIVNSPGGDGIYVVEGCNCEIDYNDVWNNADFNYYCPEGSIAGTHDISADPLFTDDDGRLEDDSPCVDRGDNIAVNMIGTKEDKFGNPRVVDGDGDGIAVVDMGIYEVENMCQGDIQGGVNQVSDHVVDGLDLAEFASQYNQCTGDDCSCDLNHDRMVTWKDLEIFVQDFGRDSCP